MASRVSNTRRQIRGFVLIWTAVTFAMAAATFLAIYFTYSPATNLLDVAGVRNVALPSPSVVSGEGDKVILPSVTPRATNTPSPTNTTEPSAPTSESQAALPTDEPTELPPPTTQPTLIPVEDKRFQVGIQVQTSPALDQDEQDGWYRSVREDMNVRWIKQQVRWEIIEPEKGQYDWSILDLAMKSAREYRLKMMLSIVTAPDWARESGIDVSRHGPPATTQDYVAFVTAILNRYPGQVHAIEVWNEQNIDREWTSMQGLKASNYVALLRDTYNAVKAIDPGIIIISGALSPTGLNDGIGAWDDFVYMEQLIQAGMLNYADCVGAHHNGYNVSPDYRYNEVPNDPTALFRGPFDNPHHSWTFRSTLEGYANRIQQAGSDKKLCITEFGWPVSEDIGAYPRGFEFAADNTLQEQAAFFVQALDNMEEWQFVWLAFIWNFNYGPQAGWDPNNDNVPYSLVGPGFTFRPAYDAIKEWQNEYLERLRTQRSS